jgi:hypothetical protein
VQLPRARRSRLESRLLRVHVSRVLEAAGVTVWPCANAPRVGGDLDGSVRVRVIELRGPLDASHVAAPAPAKGEIAGR